MDSELARKFLDRRTETQSIIRQILPYFDIDYDNEECYQWELRSAKSPDKESNSGETNITKLYINGLFVINVMPMTDELLQTINECYPKQAIDNNDQSSLGPNAGNGVESSSS